MVSHYFVLSRLSQVENTCLPLTEPINSPLSRSKLVHFSCANIKGFCKTIPDFFTRNILRDPTIWGKDFNSQRKYAAKRFPAELSQTRESLYCLLSHTLKKDPLQLNNKGHCGITLLRILIGRFSESTNVSLPFIRVLFEPRTFGFVIPDITPIQHALVNTLKP